MSYARELNSIPISDGTPEIHFGNSQGDYFMWVEFQKTDGTIWRGSFSCGETTTRTVIELENEKHIVIANGIGYIIDNATNALDSKISKDEILCCEKINSTKCLLADYDGFYILSATNSFNTLCELLSVDWVEIETNDEEKIIGKIEAAEYQWKMRHFMFDKKTEQFTIKKPKRKWRNPFKR